MWSVAAIDARRRGSAAIKSSGCQPAKTNCSHLASAYYRDTGDGCPPLQLSLFPFDGVEGEMFIYETASPTRTGPFVSVGRRGFERQSNVFGGKRASLIARNLRIRYPRGLAVLNYRHDYGGIVVSIRQRGSWNLSRGSSTWGYGFF